MQNNILNDIIADDLFIAADNQSDLSEENDSIKTYKIPVEWIVYDTVKIKARNAKEAIRFVRENYHLIPLGTSPEYADGSYHINGDDLEYSDTELTDMLYDWWNFAETTENYGVQDVYEDYITDFCNDHNGTVEQLQERGEIDGSYPLSLDEFLEEVFLKRLNANLVRY